MKLSYIIPVYNVEKYLRECIDSLLLQSFDSYEVILIDDASPDSCPQICDEYKAQYPEKFKVVHTENGGPARARNIGLSLACGEYIVFADSDDFFADDRIAVLYDIAHENKLDILHNTYYIKNDETGERRLSVSKLEKNKLFNHNDMEKIICRCSTDEIIPYMWRNLYKREFLIRNNILLDENLRRVEDPPFNLLAFGYAERFMAVDMPLYCYRIRSGSLQRSYVKDYEKSIYYQWNLKIKYYEKCFIQNNLFYADLAEYTIKSVFISLLKNIYLNNSDKKYKTLKNIGNSEMMRRSFKDYDINKFRSKSLDWLMTLCVKHKFYLPAHLLCRKVLFKQAPKNKQTRLRVQRKSEQN